MLSAEQIADYRRDGFVVLEGFVGEAALDELRARAAELEAEFLAGNDSHTEFSTADQSHASEVAFIESASKVRGFFEPGSDRLNKIGHAMHDLDPVFDRFVRGSGFDAVAAAIGVTDPLLVQSMYIYKHPGIGGEVTWHTDHTFLWSEPRSVVGFWVAIDEATTDNGCLWAIPGGHSIPVKSRFVRTRDGQAATTEVYDDSPYPIDRAVPLPASPGTLVLLDGALPHWSDTNRSGDPRQAFTLHIVDGTTEWSERNWLQRDPALPFRGFASPSPTIA